MEVDEQRRPYAQREGETRADEARLIAIHNNPPPPPEKHARQMDAAEFAALERRLLRPMPAVMPNPADFSDVRVNDLTDAQLRQFQRKLGVWI